MGNLLFSINTDGLYDIKEHNCYRNQKPCLSFSWSTRSCPSFQGPRGFIQWEPRHSEHLWSSDSAQTLLKGPCVSVGTEFSQHPECSDKRFCVRHLFYQGAWSQVTYLTEWQELPPWFSCEIMTKRKNWEDVDIIIAKSSTSYKIETKTSWKYI